MTIWLSYLLYRTYRVNRRRFYLLWAYGFLFYGANILVRLLPEETLFSSNLSVVSFLLLFTGFSTMLVAIGDLVDKGNLMVILSVFLIILNFIIYQVTGEWIQVSIIVGLLQFLLISVSLVFIQFRWKIDLRLLTIGWLTVFLTNIALTTGVLDQGLTEIISTLNKVLLYDGITKSRFNYIVEDLQRFFISGVPSEPVELERGSLSLVHLGNGSRSKEVNWIKERIERNARKGVNTMLIVCYDLITASFVSSENPQEHLYIVRLMGSNTSRVNVFDKHIMTISDDINQLDILFSDIFHYSEERRFPCEIIFYSFSHLIHTHGWNRVYAFIISQVREIKASNIHLLGFYYPETHENKSEVAMLEKMVDRIITG